MPEIINKNGKYYSKKIIKKRIKKFICYLISIIKVLSNIKQHQ